MKHRIFKSKLFILLIAVIITLISTELFLSTFHPIDYMKPPGPIPNDTWHELLHRRSHIPGLSYELVPNKEKYSHGTMIRTNSYGMRDQEPFPLSDTSVCNIIVVGDSFTFGFGVSEQDTYPNILEELLGNDTTGGNIQVLNLGVGGYSIRDETIVIKYKGLKWKPKLIVIGYVLNDPEINPFQPLHNYYQKPHWWQYLNILRLIAKTKKKCDINRIGHGDYIRYLHAQNYKIWKSVLKAFNEIKSLTQKQNIPVILVIFPWTLPIPWKYYPFHDLHSQLTEAGRRNGFYVINLLETFTKYSPSDLMVSRADNHPTKFGHKLVAQVIYKTIMDNSLKICQ